MLWMWCVSQLCEQTQSYFGQQLTCNSTAQVPQHLLMSQVESVLVTNPTHNGLDVGMTILWSLWGLDFTTCDNLL